MAKLGSKGLKGLTKSSSQSTKSKKSNRNSGLKFDKKLTEALKKSADCTEI